jgi:hypothetical protein
MRWLITFKLPFWIDFKTGRTVAEVWRDNPLLYPLAVDNPTSCHLLHSLFLVAAIIQTWRSSIEKWKSSSLAVLKAEQRVEKEVFMDARVTSELEDRAWHLHELQKNEGVLDVQEIFLSKLAAGEKRWKGCGRRIGKSMSMDRGDQSALNGSGPSRKTLKHQKTSRRLRKGGEVMDAISMLQ